MKVSSVPFPERFWARLRVGTRPSVPEGTGDAHWNASTSTLSLANNAGTAWVEYTLGASGGVGSGGTGFTSYTKGDLLVGNAGTTLSKLPVGSNNQLLIADSTQSLGLRYGTASVVNGGTGFVSYAHGDLLVGNTGTTLSKLGISGVPNNYVLTRTSSGVSWQPPNATKLFSQTATVTVFSTTETSLIGSGVGSLTLPANSIAAGDVLRFTAGGEYENDFGGSYSVTIHVRLNTSFSFANATINPVSLNPESWSLECIVLCKTDGVSGTTAVNAKSFVPTNAGLELKTFFFIPSNPNINTTIANNIDLTAQWSISSPTNCKISCEYALLEKL